MLLLTPSSAPTVILALFTFIIPSSTGHNVDTELEIEITHPVVPPCKRPTQNGDRIGMRYTGTFANNGDEFDSNLKMPEPFWFKLGAGEVIQGWDKGLLDMCVGEQRRLTIPPQMGYGDHTVGPIPGGSTLGQ
jgi:FK506-binding protein 2